MATPRRVLRCNGVYHVFTCGTGPSEIFRDAGDHEHFEWTLGKSIEMYAWKLLLLVHMTTHVHLIVRTPEANLDRGVQRTKSCQARHFNTKYRRRGALFDARYGYRVIESDRQFLRTVRYVARNPVEAALCEQPADWRWSTIGATLRRRNTWPANAAHELVLRCGGHDALERLVNGLEDVEDADALSLQPQRL